MYMYVQGAICCVWWQQASVDTVALEDVLDEIHNLPSVITRADLSKPICPVIRKNDVFNILEHTCGIFGRPMLRGVNDVPFQRKFKLRMALWFLSFVLVYHLH
jgi:hypothetical protein